MFLMIFLLYNLVISIFFFFNPTATNFIFAIKFIFVIKTFTAINFIFTIMFIFVINTGLNSNLFMFCWLSIWDF